MPSDRVLRWAAGAVDGTRVVSTESLGRGGHRPSGTFRLKIEGPAARATDVILKVPVEGWIRDVWVITNARALQRAETHGLAAPRLIAADLDGRASGTVATLETFLSGSADVPPTASVARLREAGAALARVHAVSMAPRARLAEEQDRMLAAVLWAVLLDPELALSAAQRDVGFGGSPTSFGVAPAASPPAVRRRRPGRRTAARFDANHTAAAGGRRAGQVAWDADDDVGVPAWRRVGRQHAVGGRPLRRPHRLEDGRSW